MYNIHTLSTCDSEGRPCGPLRIIIRTELPFYLYFLYANAVVHVCSTLYLFYVDESGDVGVTEQKNFVLGCIAVHEGQVYRFSKQLDDIQKRYFPERQLMVGFHATDIRNGHGIFRELNLNVRDDLLREIYGCIANARFPNLIAFASTMHVSLAKSPNQVLHDTFQDICQRFNIFMTRQFNANRPTKGLLVIDDAHRDRYRELIADFRREGTDYQGPLGNIVDIPYFARQHETRMLQLADFCAYAVFRYYERGDRTYFDQIFERFDKRAPRSPPDGLKHFTKDPCSCEACSWR
jgi:hypothetical protein